jgi:hypothetical protein
MDRCWSQVNGYWLRNGDGRGGENFQGLLFMGVDVVISWWVDIDWLGWGLGSVFVEGMGEGMIGAVDVDMQGKPNGNWSSGFIHSAYLA